MITALAGGVGAARFLQGVTNVVRDEELSVIVNTGDDTEFYGLRVSPDIDIVIYTLAGVVDEEKGWGIRRDTFECLNRLRFYGYETWFALGDRDLATHIHRTVMLASGARLSEVTDDVRKKLGVRAKIIPMTDEGVSTVVETERGEVEFQEYMVRRSGTDQVSGVRFKGIDRALPAPGVIESIQASRRVLICPSNPIVSIGTILSVKNVRNAIRETAAKVVGVSPIIKGATVKGPADKMMQGMGLEASALGVAKYYLDLLDVFVIDREDENLKEDIEALGIKVLVTNTLMKTMDDKIRLASLVVGAAA